MNRIVGRDNRMDRGRALIAVASFLFAGTVQAITIDEAVEAALENNPGLQAAMHRVDAARAAATQVRSAYYPTVFVSGNYTRTDNPTHAFMSSLNQRTLDMNDPALDFNDPDDTDNLRLTTGMRYRLYDGGQRRATRTIAGLGIDAERHATDAFQNTLIYMVKEGYYRALQARDLVAVHEETVHSLEESLRVARERLDAGSAIITDVLNLEVQVAQAREEWIRAKHGFELSLSALNTAIGMDLVSPDTLTHPGPAVAGPPLQGGETQETSPPPERIDDHPELQAARAMFGIRDQDVLRARRAYAPTLSAFGTLDWDSDVSSDFERSYLVGVVAEWDVFDGFRKRGALRESRARRAEAEAEYDQTRNALLLEVKQAHTRAKDAHERITVTRASEESAKKALAITREQYEQGVATLADLLTAQSGLTAMHTRRTAALYDYLTALANRERAQGLLIRHYQKESNR